MDIKDLSKKWTKLVHEMKQSQFDSANIEKSIKKFEAQEETFKAKIDKRDKTCVELVKKVVTQMEIYHLFFKTEAAEQNEKLNVFKKSALVWFRQNIGHVVDILDQAFEEHKVWKQNVQEMSKAKKQKT